MEAEYPDQLCLKLAKLIFDLATRAGFDPNTFAPPAKLRERREAMAAAASRQPRGTRFPRPMPEYKEIQSVTVSSSSMSELEPLIGRVLPQTWMILLDLPGRSGRP